MKQLYASVFVAGMLLSSFVYAQIPAYAWTKDFYGSVNGSYVYEGSGSAIATDSSGNVYTTGWFDGTVDFDPGPGVTNLTSTGIHSMFVLKLDGQGNFVWVRALFGGSTGMSVIGSTIAVDPAGTVYAAGNFHGTIDFDPGAGVTNMTSTGPRDMFALKLDTQGNFVWAAGILGGYVESPEICADAQGNVHLAGYYTGTMDADPGAGTQMLPNTMSTLSDMFIIKLDLAGGLLWARTIGSSGADYITSVHLDAAGNVYTTGSYKGTVDFDPGAGVNNLTSLGNNNDVFILKLDPAGNFTWAQSVGGVNADLGVCVIPDPFGNTYISGSFQGTCDFDPSSAVYNLTSVLSSDEFVMKLSPEGHFEWAVQFSLLACGNNFNLALDPSGDPYLAGNFKDSADFNPGTPTFMMYPNASIITDMFIVKLTAMGVFQWALQVGGNMHVNADAITIANDYSIFTYGFFSGTPDFDPGAGVDNIAAVQPQSLFVHKLSQNPTIGISENDLAMNVSVYPNPGAGLFNISTTTIADAFIITDVTGKEILRWKPVSTTEQLDLTAQSAGVYFVRIIEGDQQLTVRIVKE